MRRAARWARAVRWYLRELTGESEYDRYCLHRHRHHPQRHIHRSRMRRDVRG